MGKPFNIIVCGAGIAGLGAAIALKRKGHRVTVIEAASQLNEIGAGIQIPPNSSRILKSYGLEDKFLKSVVRPANLKLRRYANGDVIGLTPFNPVMTETYGYPLV
jgi:salicylate hydroxylase